MREELSKKAKQLAQDNEAYVVALRREFHMYPEVSYQEERTSKRIQEELDAMGIPYFVTEDRSVIGTINGKPGGKTLAIRGDIDALSMQDEKDVEYKSKIDGAAHTCGHDAHGAMLLGIGKMLQELKDEFTGTVKLVFHVAEEIGGGYVKILEHFEEIGGVDRVIATHVWAGLDAGTISIEPGPRMAGASGLEIEVTGRGGHGSRPDQSINPLLPLCDIITKLPYVSQYFYNALETSIVSIAMLNCGTQGNIFADRATAKGGIRFFTPEAQQGLEKHIKNIAENIAKAYGATAKVTFPRGIGPVVNDEDTVKLAREVVEEMDGLTLDPFEQICASDCYGMILQKYPGCYCFMGIRNEEKGIVYPQHHVKYDIDESTMKLNCEFLCKYALKYLS